MRPENHQNGFTLIELLIGMAISVVVMTAVIIALFNIQTTSTAIDQRSNIAMNARGALFLIEENIRLLGFNPEGDMSNNEVMDTGDGCCARGGFFTFNRNDLDDPTDDADDVTVDIGLAAADDIDGGVRDGFADSGTTSLVIQGQTAADNIEVIRFAYAFDDDGDGNVDLSANNNIRWAIDTDGDGELDTELDTNDDGEIDNNDVVGGSGMTNSVDIDKIRSVKVWLVIRSKHPLKGDMINQTYVVGDQRYTPNDNFAHLLHTSTIRCRNMI